MTRLTAYEKALTLYGKIFSHLRLREDRYFLATIKYDLVFFLYALIWKSRSLSSWSLAPKPPGKIGNHFFPRNFNEWRFGNRFILFQENDSNWWNKDKLFFRKDKIQKRIGKKIAVLTYGLDLEKAFDFQDLIIDRKIGAVIDWKGDLGTSLPFKVIKKTKFFLDLRFFNFLFKNFKVLFKIYRFLIKNYQTNLTWFDFFRYFAYCALISARIRFFLKILSADQSIGKVIFSDLDNSWGNSFLFWSYFYGFGQICYPHGSSLYFNKNRYFNPEICYVWTTYHQKAIAKEGYFTKIILDLPPKLKKSPPTEKQISKNKVVTLAFITTMEKNLEVPFSNKKILLDYLDALSRFLCHKKLSLIIKSHKLLDWHQDYDRLTKKYPCLKHIKRRWKIEDLPKVDLAILTNPETTLTLQLLSMGIPVITLAEVMPKIWTNHFSVPYFQFVVKTKSELFDLLERFFQDKGFYQKAHQQAKLIFSSMIQK